MVKSWLEYSIEVLEAKKLKKPIVALESTIIAHGMPYPQNVETAKEVENIIRENGAVPATIAIINGKIKIGLSNEELQFLATSENVQKASRRDLPYLVATKKNGATTVASTMICAQMANIEVFVTGGIGGVHRGAEKTMDISADLQELARTNVAVVCAGAKSILDLGLTLEYLETHGVPVVGYETNIFPAFFTRKSPFHVNYRVNSPEEAAEIIRTKWDLGLNGGLVIANPIPEKDALNEAFMNSIIEEALKQAKENHITGKEVTPFLLSKVKELTNGSSLNANISLIKHNAEIGAKIAISLKK
ncbi:pseudouridine-5'-phosphate glycosidase [Bacillus aquiflavi]|uniref:Pseudouridine-5'-phosphate glycosidase n=1 Tax=Bacillus aquiflavi TaxID=2672567 RepID=A0A6B3VZS5_9BACI|nr:pseudouridine-5'-phosphate glycosidase [Bacillus aquiflavi]MBA4536734.1 pseudouridine-5'-phosphate glycosidase [Bacillus aquiflavi]NEY81101.1 pseudouridine-5'-phosphate glycosidase [Bacillus aquiflavi]UAC48765.1 pseudouridine-5'-phosphate glycosidase [Bacillus aquiflavi]